MQAATRNIIIITLNKDIFVFSRSAKANNYVISNNRLNNLNKILSILSVQYFRLIIIVPPRKT